MNPQGAQHYLRTKVLTATPEQLQMMLFDGAIRFCEQARVALLEKKFDVSYKTIVSAQKIVSELSSSMKRDLTPELCKNLASIYNYAYKKLLDANLKHNVDSLDEATRMIKYQRETWSILMQKLAKEKAGNAARSLDIPGPNERMEATISMQG